MPLRPHAQNFDATTIGRTFSCGVARSRGDFTFFAIGTDDIYGDADDPAELCLGTPDDRLNT